MQTLCYVKGRANIIILPKQDVLLDIKIGNKSSNNSCKKRYLNNVYRTKNDNSGYFVDSIPQNVQHCIPCKKYKQANINVTNNIITSTLEKANASNQSYKNIAEDIDNIYNLCKERGIIFDGASIFLIRNKDGSIKANLADLSHPLNVNVQEFDNSSFAQGLYNFKNFIFSNVIDVLDNNDDNEFQHAFYNIEVTHRSMQNQLHPFNTSSASVPSERSVNMTQGKMDGMPKKIALQDNFFKIPTNEPRPSMHVRR